MTVPVRISLRAEADLASIVDHIKADRPMAARRQLERLLNRIDKLADFPASGAPMTALGPTVRMVSAPPFLILYELSEAGVLVSRVIHGAMRRP